MMPDDTFYNADELVNQLSGDFEGTFSTEGFPDIETPLIYNVPSGFNGSV